jgi:threonine/homoserine efflux transporter RhtA
MTNIKTLTLAAVTALSLGLGTAMAQESGGGVGPWETEQLRMALAALSQTGDKGYVENEDCPEPEV